MDKQVLFDEVALHVSDHLGLKSPPMGQRFITSIAVEFMLKRYAPLVEAAIAVDNMSCGLASINETELATDDARLNKALNNLKELSHD